MFSCPVVKHEQWDGEVAEVMFLKEIAYTSVCDLVDAFHELYTITDLTAMDAHPSNFIS